MKSLEDIYGDIASHVIKQIDEEWKSCIINATFMLDVAEFDIFYMNENGINNDLDGGYSLFNLFKLLHEITTVNPDNNWNRAIFTLESTGDFNIDLVWDQALADEIESLNNE
ncbi:hypothetical protein ACCH70_002531 [Vibrio vulnificus]|nr:hypothetical protein [Vibrio vulnificus]EHH1186964.1 hypothetical protein [Vibrio vulnificus]EHH2476918.1 hypothetical protein [Vibrio vulnificus]EHH2486616.1 hypothetical protein [Vibrio vulnificus]EHI9276404.1 hypothetical protein [Vibrio vulnificus]